MLSLQHKTAGGVELVDSTIWQVQCTGSQTTQAISPQASDHDKATGDAQYSADIKGFLSSSLRALAETLAVVAGADMTGMTCAADALAGKPVRHGMKA